MAERGGRIVGIDVARALAVVGMVAVHFAPRPNQESGLSAWLLGFPFGKASILFALVAGIGVSIIATRRPELVRPRLVYRFVWLLPVGLWLQALDHPVAVILQYYALWFALAALFVRVRDRTLLWWAAGLLPIGSLAVAWVGVNESRWLLVERGDSPGGVPMDLLLTGYYPTVTWFPVVLVGMWLGRRALRSIAFSWRLVGVGVVGACVSFGLGTWLASAFEVDTGRRSWGRLLSIDGHSEMPLAVLGGLASMVAVLGLCLLVSSRWPRVVRPVAALGEGALTVYVGHLVVWHLVPDLFPSSSTADTWTAVGWFFVVTALGMWAWHAAFTRGPLETVVRYPWKVAVEPLVRLARGEPAEEVLERVKGIEPS